MGIKLDLNTCVYYYSIMSNKILCPLNKLLINLELKANRLSSTECNILPETARCHCCKNELSIDNFYSSKGIIDRFKCKICYKFEFRRLVRESVL